MALSEPGVTLAEYSCPLINPPSQRHMFGNKLHNIQLAISRMQGIVLQPGEEFSFWALAKAPVPEQGYREGAMFINQRVTSSIGGGLCQLSGLIYNLALLSACDISERFNHSIDAYGEARYIPLGRDATVAYGKKGLRFRNPHPFPLRFELDVNEERASGRVLAPMALPMSVAIEAETLRVIPSPLRQRHDSRLAATEIRQTEGLSGKVVRSWRIMTGPDGRARRELLGCDHYLATPTLQFRRFPWWQAAFFELLHLLHRVRQAGGGRWRQWISKFL